MTEPDKDSSEYKRGFQETLSGTEDRLWAGIFSGGNYAAGVNDGEERYKEIAAEEAARERARNER